MVRTEGADGLRVRGAGSRALMKRTPSLHRAPAPPPRPPPATAGAAAGRRRRGVGQMAAPASLRMGAGRVIAIDRFPERLGMAAAIGAEPLDDELFKRKPDGCVRVVFRP